MTVEDLRAAVNQRGAQIEQLESQLDRENEQQQVTSRLNVIGNDMTTWADRLQLEHTGRVRIDPVQLSVVVNTPDGPVSLERMGSGGNWVGYHLIAYLALHKWFVLRPGRSRFVEPRKGGRSTPKALPRFLKAHGLDVGVPGATIDCGERVDLSSATSFVTSSFLPWRATMDVSIGSRMMPRRAWWTALSLLIAMVMYADVARAAPNDPCPDLQAACAFETRTFVSIGGVEIESITANGQYWNFSPDGSPWPDLGRFTGALTSVPRYRDGTGPCAGLAVCNFDTRAWVVIDGQLVESITRGGQFWNFSPDGAPWPAGFAYPRNLAEVPRYAAGPCAGDPACRFDTRTFAVIGTTPIESITKGDRYWHFNPDGSPWPNATDYTGTLSGNPRYAPACADQAACRFDTRTFTTIGGNLIESISVGDRFWNWIATTGAPFPGPGFNPGSLRSVARYVNGRAHVPPPPPLGGPPPGTAQVGDITYDDLVLLYGPFLKKNEPKIRWGLPSLNEAMRAAAVTTPERRAAFLTMIKNESGFLFDAKQGQSSEATTTYGHGRGFIQLTSKGNYKAAGKALGHDFVKYPEDARSLKFSGPIAAWYWTTARTKDGKRSMNDAADQLDMRVIFRTGLWRNPKNARERKEEEERVLEFTKARDYFAAQLRGPAVPQPAPPASVGSPYRLPLDSSSSALGSGELRKGHHGKKVSIDLIIPEGTPVYSVLGGTVVKAELSGNGKRGESGGTGCGWFVRVASDDGFNYLYCHANKGQLKVSKGQRVEAGQQLMTSGNTGSSGTPHLHFEIRRYDKGSSGHYYRYCPGPLLRAIAAGQSPDFNLIPRNNGWVKNSNGSYKKDKNGNPIDSTFDCAGT